MLFFKIIRKDLKRQKGSIIVVFAFIMISSLLISSGTRLIMELNNALDALFSTAEIPHFVQMHSGKLDIEQLDHWSDENNLIEDRQVVEMITIDGSSLFLSEGMKSEENSIMDISFVKQNDSFDFLLDSANRIAEISPGDVGVPVYYAEQRNVQIGDLIRVRTEDREQSYKVSAVLRDAQMNPAIVHSKRFLLNDGDYIKMRELFSETEYLIEFRLTDKKKLDTFTNEYLSAGMPQQGPTVDHRLFKILNGLSDGIVGVIIIILSFLLMMIAILCLRFIIITAIEEDYKEIGVMKAVGMPQSKIRQIYLFKYIAMGGMATITGFLISLSTNRFLMANSMLYLGKAAMKLITVLAPAVSVAFIFLFILFSVLLILRRFKRISAVQALQAGDKTELLRRSEKWELKHSGSMNINLFLGIRDVFKRFKKFGLLTFVFIISSFITILPVNFLTTISSTEFISYMGIGRCDIRIDLHQTDKIRERFKLMIESINKDSQIEAYSPLVTSQFTLVKENGETNPLIVESGDFSIFPLDYMNGREPQNRHEIALSYLNSRDLKKDIGDILVLEIEGENQDMLICGVYQDITNGGRTAKACIPYNEKKVLWYTLSLNLKTGVSIPDKVGEYSSLLSPARVTDMETYLSQTLGNTISQLRKITITAIIIGLSVAMLITSLFLRMMISRDKGRIAVMRSLGFSLGHIRLQYLAASLLLLIIGIIAGTLFTNTAGQALISFLISFMGAARIQLIINPLLSSLLLPILLICTVSLTTVISINGIKDYTIAAAIAE